MQMDVSLCLIAKDENSYLKEWLDFHILLGVDHFWIYDNESAFPIRQSIQEYIDKGWVTVNLIHGKGMQLFAYDHCIQTYGSLTKWIGFIDTDEFIIPKTGENLPRFLKKYEKFGGLAISSLFFGAGGNQTRPMCGQIAGYQIRSREDLSTNMLTKSIVQPEKVIFPISPHNFMYTEGNYCINENELRVDTQSFPCSTTRIQLNHYYTRSAQEWKEKIQRGRGDMGDPYSDQRWKNANDHSKVIDNSAIHLSISQACIPPSISKNLTALTNSNSDILIKALSKEADKKVAPVCKVKPVDSVTIRKEFNEHIDYLTQGLDFLKEGKFLEARNLYIKKIQEYPFDLIQYIYYGTACLNMRDFPNAWEALSQAWKISPRGWTVLLCMIDYFYAVENYDQVEKCSYLVQEYGNLEPIGVAVLALAQWKNGKKEQAKTTADLLFPQLSSELIASHDWFQELMRLIYPERMEKHGSK